MPKTGTNTYHTLEDIPSYWREDIRDLVEEGAVAGADCGKLGGDIPVRLFAVVCKKRQCVGTTVFIEGQEQVKLD